MLIYIIWKIELGKKRMVNMASKTLKTANKPISFSDFEKDVARRVENAGPINMPRNSGKNRTQSKKRLLLAIEKVSTIW